MKEANEQLPFYMDKRLFPDFETCGISPRNEFQALSLIRNAILEALEDISVAEDASEDVPVASELGKLRHAQAAIYLEQEVETLQLALDGLEKVHDSLLSCKLTTAETRFSAQSPP